MGFDLLRTEGPRPTDDLVRPDDLVRTDIETQRSTPAASRPEKTEAELDALWGMRSRISRYTSTPPRTGCSS